MLFSRLKSWPKWRPCCLLHFNLTKALGTRIASISNRPRFDPGDGQNEVWRENLANQMTESLFAPEYKFVFTLNSFLSFGLDLGQRCLKDSFLSMQPPHCSLRPTLTLFTSKRPTIWTVFTVGTCVVVYFLRSKKDFFGWQWLLSLQQEHENWWTKAHFDSRKPRRSRKARCKWKKPLNVKAAFTLSVGCA